MERYLTGLLRYTSRSTLASSRTLTNARCLSSSPSKVQSGVFAQPTHVVRDPSNKDNKRLVVEEDHSDADLDDPSLAALSRHMQTGYMILLPKPPYKQGVKHIPVRPVPGLTLKPPYVGNEEGYEPRPEDDGFVSVSSEEQGVRAAAVLAKKTLQKARELVKPGLTTDELDAKLHEFICSHGAYPSPLAYHGFPKSICTSVNNVIAHGIPDARPLEDGDIVNVDVTVFLHGWHGDTSATFLVGNVDPRGRELVRAAEDALEAGIKACRHGQHFRNIGASIEECIRERYPGMRVNRQFSGHGIGMVFHRPPWILHHDNDEPGRMSQGMCFTIEPCIVDDEDARGWLWPDGWTVSTETGARSAQAEHMVLIREDGIEVLTR